MFEFSLIMIPVITLLIPVIMLTVYCYVKRQGWKAVMWGCLSMLVTVLLSRLVLPALVLNQAWFISLMENPVPYSLVYSLCFTLVYALLSWLSLQFLVKPQSVEQGMTFGFSQGVAYTALFIGFPAMSALLSDASIDLGDAGIGGLWLSIIEGLIMMLYLAVIGWMMEKALMDKKPVLLVAGAAVFYLVLEWGLWANMNLSRIWILLVLAAGLAVLFWLFRTSLPLKTLFTEDE